MAAQDITPTIGTITGQPAAVSGDAGSFTQQRIPDLIAADQYLALKAAAAKRGRGLRFTKLIGPPQVPGGGMPGPGSGPWYGSYS